MYIERLSYFHSEGIYAYLSNPAESPDLWWKRPESPEETYEWVHTMCMSASVRAFAVMNDDTEVIGVVSFREEMKGVWAIGFYFRSSARGGLSGIVKDCIRKSGILLEKDARIFARPNDHNTRCHTFLMKFGFRREGSEFVLT